MKLALATAFAVLISGCASQPSLEFCIDNVMT